jgi:WD40 repeat protein
MRSLTACLTVVIFGIALWLSSSLPGQEKKAAPAEVKKLIDQLGDDDEGVRKEAAKKLEALGETVLPALRAASKSHADVDVRLRAAVIAAAIHKKQYGEIHTFTGHQGWVYRVVVTPDGKQAISSGDQLRVWNLQTGKQVRQFMPGVWAWGLAVSRDGKRVLASHSDRVVRLYEVETGKELQKLAGHTSEVWATGLSADGKFAVTGALDRSLRVWDLETGKQTRSFANVIDYPRCLALSPDGKKVAVGHYSGGDFLKAAGTLRIWDFATGKEVATGTGHEGAITAVSWSKDGKRVATSSFDKTVRVWNARTGKELKRITASTQACDGVAFLPDGKRLVSTGWGTDTSVRLWGIETGRELVRYDGHTANCICVAVTPDGKKAIAGDAAGTLRLWPLPK